MDERYEALCEIGQVLIDAGKADLLTVYSELLLEHYPVELLEVFGAEESSEEEYKPQPEPEPEPEVQCCCGEKEGEKEEEKEEEPEAEKDIVVDGVPDWEVEETDDEIDSEDDESEEEGKLVKEELTVKVDENGFHALA